MQLLNWYIHLIWDYTILRFLIHQDHQRKWHFQAALPKPIILHYWFNTLFKRKPSIIEYRAFGLFTSSCVNKDGEDLEKIIELNNDIILLYYVGIKIFHQSSNFEYATHQSAIPYSISVLTYVFSYRFFKLLNGSFSGFNKDFCNHGFVEWIRYSVLEMSIFEFQKLQWIDHCNVLAL